MKISLAEAAQRAIDDPELLNLTVEVGIVQARLGELLKRADSEESAKRWQKASETFRLFMDARARKDSVGYSTALEDLAHLFRDGNHDYMLWEDIQKTLKTYQSLIAQEQKRRLDMNALISADQAVGMLAEVMYAIKECVSDRNEQNALYIAIQHIIERKPHLSGA